MVIDYIFSPSVCKSEQGFFILQEILMFSPSLEEVKKLAQKFSLVPIVYEMPSDFTTPINVLKVLKLHFEQCFLFESVDNTHAFGRYSFLGYEPSQEITCLQGEVITRDKLGERKDVINPRQYLKKLLQKYSSPRYENLPSFTGGLVGYFAYDFIKYSEPTLRLDMEDAVENFNDLDLMLFKKIIIFDNYKQKLYLVNNIEQGNIEQNYKQAIKEIQITKKLIINDSYHTNFAGQLSSDFSYLFDKKDYMHMVETAKKHIYEGDIFQVVLSNRMEANFEGSLFNTYRTLRMTNPSPYMFYLSSQNNEIVGASPETLVKLQDNTVYTFPLAGTRKRGKNAMEDQKLEAELLADAKEVAEHTMLVDLGRNDLGKICKFGTVEVRDFMQVHHYSHVMHLGSTVHGAINEQHDALDAIEAVLPAGTLSGAPKIKACEIINKLEQNKRGLYGGAIGYIDFTGNMDTCIAIRLCFKKNNKIYIRSGAGIVADSVPEKEYEECIAKARAVVEAVQNSTKDFE